MRLRGYRTKVRPSAPSAAELARIDLCWSAATGLALVDHFRGAYFQARYFLFAAELCRDEAGERTRAQIDRHLSDFGVAIPERLAQLYIS